MSCRLIRIASLNVNGIKASVQEIDHLCERADIIFIQELQILPFDCDILGRIHKDFFGFAITPVNVEEGIVRGRPPGGVGVMWRKSLAPFVEIAPLLGVNFAVGLKWLAGKDSLLLLGVYMPYDDGSQEQLSEYVDKLANIGTLIEDVGLNCLCVGDFNASYRPPANSRFFKELEIFCADYNLVNIDTEFLVPNSYTFLSAVHNSTSWIDHVIGSTIVKGRITKCEVLYDVCVVDHMPVLIDMYMPDVGLLDQQELEKSVHKYYWSAASVYQKERIAMEIEENMQIWISVMDHMSINDINLLINLTLLKAQEKWIPSQRKIKSFKALAGWNDEVKVLHSAARQAYVQWRDKGKPRSGILLENMVTTRRSFRIAFRRCRADVRRHEDEKLSEGLLTKGPNDFWKEVKKRSTKAVAANKIGNAVGEEDISEMWANHYRGLFDATGQMKDKVQAEPEENKCRFELIDEVEAKEVWDAINQLRKDTSTGTDEISVELLQVAKDSLSKALSILFNRILKENHLPDKLIDSFILPIPKNKCGDLSSPGNYRGIAIATAMSKVFEVILSSRLNSFLKSTEAQFGFKTGHDTNLCTFVVDSTIEHYTSHGSPVFGVFLDASSAFDRVQHETLFNMLLERGAPDYLVAVLRTWYTEQSPRVKWGSTFSTPISVSRGVRQGSKLSPLLFTFYIDSLVERIRGSGIGCHINGTPLNIVVYADDIVLLAPTRPAVQKLVNLCIAYSRPLGVEFNKKKSVLVVFWSDLFKKTNLIEPIQLGPGDQLQTLQSFMHLGHILEETGRQVLDVNRFRRSFFRSLNMILRRFHFASIGSKVRLFQAYCYHFYGGELWCRLPAKEEHALEVAVNRAIKHMHGVSSFARNSLTCLDLGILTARRELALRQLNFFRRVLNSPNSLVRAVCSGDCRVNNSFFRHVKRLCNEYELSKVCFRDVNDGDLRRYFWCHQERYALSLLENK